MVGSFFVQEVRSLAQVRLTTTQAKKLKKLLDMWYRPSELADEMQLHINTVYRLIERGCPSRREDQRGVREVR